MFKSTLATLITGKPRSDNYALSQAKVQKKRTTRDLIRLESKVGGQLFGVVPKGHRREFFCLDEHAWIWYEEWVDAAGKRHTVTTRYEIHNNGVLKIQDNQPYQVVEGQELYNLAKATRMYREQVSRKIYHRDPVTGHPIAA